MTKVTLRGAIDKILVPTGTPYQSLHLLFPYDVEITIPEQDNFACLDPPILTLRGLTAMLSTLSMLYNDNTQSVQEVASTDWDDWD